MPEEKCLPLQLVEKYNKLYPDAWSYLAKCHALNGTDEEMSWDKICYVPVAAGIDVTSRFIPIERFTYEQSLHIADEAVILVTLAAWRQHKQIFEFDGDMEELLYQQTEDVKLPVDVLRSLPYPCIYIRTKKLEYNGFFVFFESDIQTKELELRFIPLKEDGQHLDLLPLFMKENMTIEGSIRYYFDETMMQESVQKKIQNDFRFYSQMITELKQNIEIVKKLLQLVLYISAKNAEIDENPVQRKIYRKPKTEHQIKDKYREIQKWDVGMETAEHIRKFKKAKKVIRDEEPNISDEVRTSASSPKRPHMRSGHWHHYWKGPRSGERQLVLNWVAPVFVNAEASSLELGVTTNLIESKERKNHG